MTDFNINGEVDKNYRANDLDLSGSTPLGGDIFAVSIMPPVPAKCLGPATAGYIPPG